MGKYNDIFIELMNICSGIPNWKLRALRDILHRGIKEREVAAVIGRILEIREAVSSNNSYKQIQKKEK